MISKDLSTSFRIKRNQAARVKGKGPYMGKKLIKIQEVEGRDSLSIFPRRGRSPVEIDLQGSGLLSML